jgi:phage shock protein C
MYCTRCGSELTEREIYCSQCGEATERAALKDTPPRPLMRSLSDKKIAGVCSGMAKYLNLDVTIVRLIWITLIFVPPSLGLIAYIVAWIVMPVDRPKLAAPQAEPTRANGY